MKRIALILPLALFSLGCGVNPEKAKQEYERNV